ncbi:RNA-directed DNA polymerase, eukaryota, reverse transcriptase zinc-binding domain protein [Tanacetum coccineum]
MMQRNLCMKKRILLGWNPNLVKVLIISKCEQAILCNVELIPSNMRFYYTIVYASNNGIDRRSLWKELSIQKQLIKNEPWVVMGDFNVTLNANEHSSGSSGKTADMIEFNDAINSHEVDDICSSGFQFTWTKSLKNLNVVKKIKNLKRPLKKLSWMNGNVFENVTKVKERLRSIQADIDKKPHDDSLRIEAVNMLNEYVEAYKDEMKLLQQKARVKWLNEGDKNTAFFHGILKSRRSKSRVEIIMDDAGSKYEGKAVNEQFVKHFEQFLGKIDNVASVDKRLFKKVLDCDEAKDMIGEVSEEEIKEAMFDIYSTKAPGPDRFTSEFFKKAWKIVGNEVCLAIKEFFNNGKLLGEELLRWYNRKNGPKRCAMQIDIQKAYDTVSWRFLEEILGNFGFHKKMVSWIMICVKSTSFTICLNGEMNGFFKGGRGLRQGDPISPYRFTLVMEVFSLIMEKNIEESKVFCYHFGCKELKLSYMCFADDLLVLCKGNRESIKVERDKLDLLQVMPLKCGKLSVRYLGVPLLAKKLGVSDYKDVLGIIYLLPVINDMEKMFKKFYGMLGILPKAKLELLGKWKTSVWYDKWCTDGPLSKFISRRDIYEARLEDNAKLSDCPNIEDKVLWDTNDGRKVEFSTNQADLRVNWPNVVRRHIVWFNHLIPRQAFIFWMAVQDKLLTQDKIEKWNHDGDFKCGLSSRWWEVDHRDVDSFDDWREWLKTIRLPLKVKDVFEGICAIVWWYTWNCRNKKIFGIETPSKAYIFDEIVGCLLWLEAILVMPLLLVMVDNSEGNVAKRDCFPEQLLPKQYMLLLGLDLMRKARRRSSVDVLALFLPVIRDFKWAKGSRAALAATSAAVATLLFSTARRNLLNCSPESTQLLSENLLMFTGICRCSSESADARRRCSPESAAVYLYLIIVIYGVKKKVIS